METVTIDIETRSDRDITKSGVYAYADSKYFDILLFSYSVDGGAVQVIDLANGEKIPDEILKAFTDENIIKQAFNVNFERVCLICLPHRAFTEYEKTSFEDITENAAFVETFYGMEEPDYACFDPYVFSEDFTEGDYDILFTFKGEIAYYVVINLTSETI